MREQPLTEICRRIGLLGALADLDFRELAAQEPEVAPLTRPHTCLGNVYAQTKFLPVWKRNLPLIPLTPK